MTATVIALVTLREDQQLALSEYLRVTEPLLKKAGGRVVKRFEINEVIVGHRPARSVVIVEYRGSRGRGGPFRVRKPRNQKASIPVRDNSPSPNYHVRIVRD